MTTVEEQRIASSKAQSFAAFTAEQALLVAPLSSGFTSAKVALTVQKQSTSYYCVPASARAMLTKLAVSLPTQSVLAGAMGTTASGGTYMANAAGPLNRYIPSSKGFQYSYDVLASSASTLWSRTQLDVNSAQAPVMVRALYGDLPWTGGSSTTGHAVVSHGWYSDTLAGTKGLYFWDPWDSTYHSTTASVAWTFNSAAGRQQVW